MLCDVRKSNGSIRGRTRSLDIEKKKISRPTLRSSIFKPVHSANDEERRSNPPDT